MKNLLLQQLKTIALKVYIYMLLTFIINYILVTRWKLKRMISIKNIVRELGNNFRNKF